MSRSHDLVGIAIGDVRVPLEELSMDERLQLFEAYARRLYDHYNNLKGGSQFISWDNENFGEKLTQHSIRRHSLSLYQTLFPCDTSYAQKTRIVVLTDDYFRLPEFKVPHGGHWNIGDTKLVIRLCLVQDGNLYLEWYEGQVTLMEKDYPTLPKRILVSVARYIKLPQYMRLSELLSDELKILLETHPNLLYSFGYGSLRLLADEITARQKRVDRDKALFTELNGIGRSFGITHL